MGNGQGLKDKTLCIDIESTPLTQQMIEDTAVKSAANHGRPIIMWGPIFYDPNPQFSGTPWAQLWRMTKKERKLAALHTFLTKLKVINFNEDEWERVRAKSQRRLKKAKWTRNVSGGEKNEVLANKT